MKRAALVVATVLLAAVLAIAADGPEIGSYPARVNGGDFNLGFITITFVDNTEADRETLGRYHDMVNVTGSSHQTFGCDTGLMDSNPTLWCNSHDNRFVTNPINDNDWNKVGRCAGDMRVACWRPGTVGGPLVTDPDYDYCDTQSLGECYTLYHNYFRKITRDVWARDIHGHKVIDYFTHRDKSANCNYEYASGYCESGTYAGQGCTGDEDCGILTSGTCSGMCSAGESDSGEYCTSDGDCIGTCGDSAAVSGNGLTAAKGSCTELDGSDCNGGFCEFDTYNCGNSTYYCGGSINYTGAGGLNECSDVIPTPTTHPIWNVTMNYSGNNSYFTQCRVLHNTEYSSDFPDFYAAYSADEVAPWSGSVPTGAAFNYPSWPGNEWGGVDGSNPQGGGLVVHFSDNSNAYHFGVTPGTSKNRKCNDPSKTVCNNNADCEVLGSYVCSSQYKGENGVRSEHDNTEVRPIGEAISQALYMYSTEATAVHAAEGLSGGAMGGLWFKINATCEDYSADYSNPAGTDYRCKLNNLNTEYYCSSDDATGDLDCERMYWDSSLRVLAGGYYCDRSMRNCPNQTECTTSDGTCTYYEPSDLIETESGNVLRGNSCYDKTGPSGSGCVSNSPLPNWHLNSNRDSGDGVWETATVDKAILKLEFWWDAADATTALDDRGRGGGEPRRPMLDMVLSNHITVPEHGKGVFAAVSNRYLFGWTYLWAIPQKNHHFINFWTGSVSATHCLHCKEAGYPSPSCTGYQTCHDFDHCSATTSTECDVDGDCPGGETCEPGLLHDVYPWSEQSLGCPTGPGVDDFSKYGVDGNIYYRNFSKGFVACNFQASSNASVTLPAAPEGKWCTQLADTERTSTGEKYDCNENGDNVVQDYDGGPSGAGFTGSQLLSAKTCIILFDEGSTQDDCDLLSEFQYPILGAAPPGTGNTEGITLSGSTLR